MGEAAREFWALDNFIDTAVARMVAGELPASAVIDEMAPVRLRPEDNWPVLRLGLISLLNGGSVGMRAFRSGRVQSTGARLRSLPEESSGLTEFADRVLSRLVFETADKAMRSVLDFTHADATAAYERRVTAPREQAKREDPFWAALVSATKGGKLLKDQVISARQRFAKLAIEARLTVGEDEQK